MMASPTESCPEAAPAPPTEPCALLHRPVLHVLLILAIGVAIYCNSFTVPFQFDDVHCLATNPAIRDFTCFTDHSLLDPLPIIPDLKNNFVLRPVGYLTFTLNYTFHGLALPGYHGVNVAIHLANALLLYLFLSLTLRTPYLSGLAMTRAGAFRMLPLFGALLFVSHPLQTQAVTYIIQRFTSLATLFFLAATVLYVQARLSLPGGKRRVCHAAAIVAAILAMKTKEIAFTLPVIIALYEWMFLEGPPVRRILRLIPLMGTMTIIPWTVTSLAAKAGKGTLHDSMDLVNFGDISRYDYLITQFGVIARYLRLLAFPAGQNLDHDFPLLTTFFQPAVLLPLGLLLLLAGLAFFLLYRSLGTTSEERAAWRLVSFGIFWFFITISVESSIIPIDDVSFEHRAYLPSVGFFTAVVAALGSAHRCRPLRSAVSPAALIVYAVVAMLSLATVLRNNVWATPVTLWQDAANKSPRKARPHTNLGVELMNVKLLDQAIPELTTALQLEESAATHKNLGIAFYNQRMFERAGEHFVTALALKADDPTTLVYLSLVQTAQVKLKAARCNLEMALRMAPAVENGDEAARLLQETEMRVKKGVLKSAD